MLLYDTFWPYEGLISGFVSGVVINVLSLKSEAFALLWAAVEYFYKSHHWPYAERTSDIVAFVIWCCVFVTHIPAAFNHYHYITFLFGTGTVTTMMVDERETHTLN